MKSELKSDVVAYVYPCLKKHADGTVILFNARGTGVCIRGGGMVKLGDFAKDWAENDFAILPENEKIALSN